MMLSLFLLLEYMPDLLKASLTPMQKALSMIIMCVSISPNIYLFFNIPRIRMFFGMSYTTADVIFGAIAATSVIWWVKRRFGWPMPMIAIIFTLYVLTGHLFPGELGFARQFTFERFFSYIFTEAGMYGTLLTTAIRVIFLYMLFGSFLQASGVGDYLIDCSLLAAGKYRGGPAKVAIISSGLLGMISGSANANVATTGAITIPLMKKTGYRAEFAGAVEAVASTGGQIMPPVMGSGAFIMAEFLGVSYATVALAAIIPAILFYLALFFQVDLVAISTGLKGAPPEDLPDKKKLIKNIHMTIPVIVLIYVLMVMRMSPTRAGLFAIGVSVLISWTSKSFRMGPKKIYKALVDGAKSSVGITAVCILAGIIVGAVSSSGLATKFSSIVLGLARDNLIITAALTAIICLILGMGLPTSAAYVITVVIALPALMKIGVLPIAGHMFVFYYAILAAVTPPVATASYTAASIARSPVMKTGLEGVKLATIAYLMPFFFINNPNLIGQGTLLEIAQSFATATLGCFLLAMVIRGVTFAGNKVRLVPRLVWIASSLLLIDPGSQTDVVGLILFAVGLFYGYFVNKVKGTIKVELTAVTDHEEVITEYVEKEDA